MNTNDTSIALNRRYSCDVLVIGAGIAGLSAALSAAAVGRRVILASSGPTFSGSSFHPGTWGLGLIGPADEQDQADLMETVLSVGRGMADPELVEVFVQTIPLGIQWLRQMGVPLRRAGNGQEREYIPCFDHKHRDWNRIDFDATREVISHHIRALEITPLPHSHLLEFVRADGRVCGAVLSKNGSAFYVGCNALVLATGGYGGLFQYHLCTEDVAGMGQALALRAGGRLVNMEFMQIMPGFLHPAPKTVYNEKTFRFTRFKDKRGASLFPDTPHWKKLLEMRAAYGPFTSRLPSRQVDLRLYEALSRNENGIEAQYVEMPEADTPEFIRTYFDWLRQAKGVTPDQPFHLGLFAHAANGGIAIDADASTGIPGLFAAGEVTGGMHGADRIGGLSTANGLVFGALAGRGASLISQSGSPEVYSLRGWGVHHTGTLLHDLRKLMTEHAMLQRTRQGLQTALDEVERMRTEMERYPTEDAAAITAGRRIEAQLITAEAILRAAALRRESRGSHHRGDYPEENAQQARPIEITWEDGQVRAAWKDGPGAAAPR